VVFTDGSFDTIGKTIKILEGDAKGNGSGAVVVMDRDFSEHPIYSWRFVGGKDFLFNSAFDVEVMMVCAAATLGSAMGRKLQVHTDCQGIEKRTKKYYKRDNFARDSNASQIRFLKAARSEEWIELKWVRSHPERRCEEDSWTMEDYGIWFADRVAGGEAEETLPGEFYIREYDMVEAAKGHDYCSGWLHWKQDGLVMLNSMTKVLKEERAGVYLNNRDEYRKKRGLEPIWRDLTTGYAAKCWSKLGKGIMTSSRSTRLMYNKIWDGRNEGKGLEGGSLKCKLCLGDNEDGMDHWVGTCGNKEMKYEREKVRCRINKVVRRSMARTGVWIMTQGYKEIIEYVQRKLLGTEDIGRLWSGLWDNKEIEEIEMMIVRVEEGELEKLRGFMAEVGTETTEGVSEIWETSSRCRPVGPKKFGFGLG
jgi:hypothetical protein